MDDTSDFVILRNLIKIKNNLLTGINFVNHKFYLTHSVSHIEEFESVYLLIHICVYFLWKNVVFWLTYVNLC